MINEAAEHASNARLGSEPVVEGALDCLEERPILVRVQGRDLLLPLRVR